jgi:hypothetical protein
MPALPKPSGRSVAKAFGRDGWPGTLRSLIRASGLTVEQFIRLAKK